MRVQVAKWGNSTAVRLPKAVVEELRLKAGQEIDLTVEGGEARLRPVIETPRVTLAALLAEADKIGWENQSPLVDWGPDVGVEVVDDAYAARPADAARRNSR